MADEYRRIVWTKGDHLPTDAQTTVDATGQTIGEDVSVYVRRTTTGYSVTKQEAILALREAERQIMEMSFPLT